MRVITGSARGVHLESPVGYDIRPTSDRVKEAMFSIIHFELENAAVLDLFAGSGQLGIEALSRGAASCMFVDASKTSLEVVKKNIEKTKFTEKSKLVCRAHDSFLRSVYGTFDIALLDPPYNQNILPDTLKLLVPKMRPSGVIICESDEKEELPERVGDFVKQKPHHFGRIVLNVYRVPDSEEADGEEGDAE